MSGWFPIDTAPKDREILAADAFGSRAVVRWDRNYWALTETGGYAESDEFDAVQWAPGALPEAPQPPARKYWWDKET